MSRTKIEWATKVWNPVTGCTKVSAGCKNCYAERMATRLAGHVGYPADEPFRVTLHPERLSIPMAWKKPQRVFVNSMSDLFHRDIPDDFIDMVFAMMAICDQHNFLVLTKRPQRLAEYMENRDWSSVANGVYDKHVRRLDGTLFLMGEIVPPLPNVWLGVSAEDQATAEARIPLLLQTPAAVRFVSYEPALGPVDLSQWLSQTKVTDDRLDAPDGAVVDGVERCGNCWTPIAPINWVICGGESGPKARPMHPDWARQVRDQCRDAGVAFFFKQWGEWWPISQMPTGHTDSLYSSELEHPDAPRQCLVKSEVIQLDGRLRFEFPAGAMTVFRVGKRAAGRLLDGREWNEFPDFATQIRSTEMQKGAR